MWEEQALRNLLDVKQVFDKNGIRFWLDYGTLLGAIRDGKLVRHMGDVDLGMMDEHWGEFTCCLQEFRNRGFAVKIKKFKVGDIVFKTAKLYRHGIYVDFSVYKVLGKYAVDVHSRWGDMKLKFLRFLYYILPLPKTVRRSIKNASSPFKKFIKVHFEIFPSKSKTPSSYIVRWLLGWKSYYYNKVPKHYFEKLDKISFFGVTFNVPSPVEDYLKYMYGEEWKVPRKDWRLMDNGSFNIFVTKGYIEI